MARACQTVEYVKDGPTTDELLEFRPLLLFLLLWLSIHVNDLRLNCRLLPDHTLSDNDIVSSSLSHAWRGDQRWSGLRLRCWIIRGYKYEKSGRAQRWGRLLCSRGGGLATSLGTVGGIEGSSAPTVMIVAMMLGWEG